MLLAEIPKSSHWVGAQPFDSRRHTRVARHEFLSILLGVSEAFWRPISEAPRSI
jgi:hypothetical protein